MRKLYHAHREQGFPNILTKNRRQFLGGTNARRREIIRELPAIECASERDLCAVNFCHFVNQNLFGTR